MTGKKRHIFSILALVFLVISCQHINKTEKPDNLIPEKKMVDILTELFLVQSARDYNKSKLEKIGVTPDTYIYEKFGIDSLQFEKSSEWYSENYMQYERIYDSVKARVEVMKKRVDSLAEREREIKDSINLAKKDSIRRLDSLGIDRDSLRDLKIREPRKKIIDSLIAPPVSTSRDAIL